jgi:hypothetical protein
MWSRAPLWGRIPARHHAHKRLDRHDHHDGPQQLLEHAPPPPVILLLPLNLHGLRHRTTGRPVWDLSKDGIIEDT